MTSETDGAGWISPQEALARWEAREVGLLPPTWVTLTELAECGSLAAAIGTQRRIEKILPKVLRDGGRVRMVLPGDPRYAGHREP